MTGYRPISCLWPPPCSHCSSVLHSRWAVTASYQCSWLPIGHTYSTQPPTHACTSALVSANQTVWALQPAVRSGLHLHRKHRCGLHFSSHYALMCTRKQTWRAQIKHPIMQSCVAQDSRLLLQDAQAGSANDLATNWKKGEAKLNHFSTNVTR